MNKRTIPAVAAGVLLAAGLLAACGTSTTPTSPTTAATTEATPATSATSAPTATETATAAPTAEATNVVAQPSLMTITVADGKVSGVLTVKDTNQGVPGAEVNLVFRPNGDGAPKIVAVKTDTDGKFATTEAVNGSGTWTASFLGNDAAKAAVAAATVG